MTLSEVARYWAAKELTRIGADGTTVKFNAPYACPDFTVRIDGTAQSAPLLTNQPLREVSNPLQLKSGTWCRDGEATTVCFSLNKGESLLSFAT
jgi:hypothetical protein